MEKQALTLLTHQSHVLKPSLLNAARSFRMRGQDPLSFPFYPPKEACKVGHALSASCPSCGTQHDGCGHATCPMAFPGARGHSWGSGLLRDSCPGVGARGSLWQRDEVARQPAALQQKVLWHCQVLSDAGKLTVRAFIFHYNRMLLL